MFCPPDFRDDTVPPECTCGDDKPRQGHKAICPVSSWIDPATGGYQPCSQG